MTKPSKQLIWFSLTSIILLVATAAIAINFTVIKDFFTGLAYRPTDEMSRIRTDLNLTDKGTLIFNATMPELKEKSDFNTLCRGTEIETAILGCYRDDRVYVYDITDEELIGIRELTSAHELLHAVYHRMSSQQKQELTDILVQVYQENQDTLGEEIDLYQDDQKKEEIYVRAGTEIRDLPDELEKHYAEIFKNQDQIADYYKSYITVFKQIEQNLETLLKKAQDLETEITTKTAEYESGATNLNQEIQEFNNCANTPNCFISRWAFNNQRNALLNRQNELENLYNEINQLISEYNTTATEYNENLLHGQALNMAINSAEKADQI